MYKRQVLPLLTATASSELEFYRHRLHLERETVQRARQALVEQKRMLDARQLQFRHSKPQSSIHQLFQVSQAESKVPIICVLLYIYHIYLIVSQL